MMTVIGRESELTAVDRFLDALPSGACALVVEGEAGIGKTTVWEAGAARAAARGWRVLTARPVEVETKLSLATLADLLEPVVDGVIADLPEPQRRALEVALLRAEPETTDVD